MAEHKYQVIREHIGDKPYAVGDERVAVPGDVAHLVPKVLKDLGAVRAKAEDAKAEDDLQNKAEGPSPSNKAAPKARKAKGAAE